MKKSRNVPVGSRKWFWLRIIVQFVVAGEWHNTRPAPAEKSVINMIWLLFRVRLAHHSDWSRWFALSSSSPICCHSFNFMGGVARKEITKLGCEKYFCWITYWVPAHHNDWSRWLAISNSSPICCHSFNFMGGVARKKITTLGCEKYFCWVTYWAPLEML